MTQDDMKKRIEELEAANEDLQNAVDAHATDLAKAYESGKVQAPRKIAGKVKLTIEDTKTGDKDTGTYTITDGHPTVRFKNGEVVDSLLLMKMANGKKLSEDEVKLNPSLVAAKKEGVIEFLSTMAAKKVGWLTKIGMILLLFTFAFQSVDAQVRSGRIYEFDADTTTNADTLLLTFPWTLSNNELYDYAWQVVAENISGTTTLTALVQESLFDEGDYWVTKDTITVSGSDIQMISGKNVGVRQRLWVQSSGTGVTRLLGIVRYRKE